MLHMYTSKGTGWNARKNVEGVGAHGDSEQPKQSHMATNVLDEHHVNWIVDCGGAVCISICLQGWRFGRREHSQQSGKIYVRIVHMPV